MYLTHKIMQLSYQSLDVNLIKMNICFMTAWFAFAIHFELNHVQNRQYSNGIIELQEEKSHAKLILVAIRPSNIHTFKEENFAFLHYQIFQI